MRPGGASQVKMIQFSGRNLSFDQFSGVTHFFLPLFDPLIDIHLLRRISTRKVCVGTQVLQLRPHSEFLSVWTTCRKVQFYLYLKLPEDGQTEG